MDRGMGRRLARAAAGMLVLLSASACRGASTSTSVTPSPHVSASPTPNETPREEVTAEDFNPDDFADPTTIDNQWFPLIPGTQFIYEGRTTEDGERIDHRSVFTVTDLTKVIAGVRTLVVWDRDYSQGELVEAELAMFAQDNAGNVWHLGQYPEEYEDGKVVDAPAWVHGIGGARAGISMRAVPQLGGSDYAQGFAPPPINWVDRARVYQTGQKTCVPSGCYEDVLVVEEFEIDKPDAYQLKYHAPGVGVVRVGWRGSNEEEKETLRLVEVVSLSPDAMESVRRAVRALEEGAYVRSRDVWAHTPPLEPL
jgi:hypothetical protein